MASFHHSHRKSPIPAKANCNYELKTGASAPLCPSEQSTHNSDRPVPNRVERKENFMNYETPAVEIVAPAESLIHFKPAGKDDSSGSGKSRQSQISTALEAED